MSIEQASGLILRTLPLTETSLIVRWLTPAFGRISTVAKGARRPHSPFHGKLDVCYEADFTFYRSRRSTLHTLREVAVQNSHPALREDLARLSLAAYGALWIEQVVEEETPVPRLHALLRELIVTLSMQPAWPQVALAFELKLLAESGLTPNWTSTALSPGSRRAAQALMSFELSLAARIQLTRSQLEELRSFLHGFLANHLGRVPSGRDALRPD